MTTPFVASTLVTAARDIFMEASDTLHDCGIYEPEPFIISFLDCWSSNPNNIKKVEKIVQDAILPIICKYSITGLLEYKNFDYKLTCRCKALPSLTLHAVMCADDGFRFILDLEGLDRPIIQVEGGDHMFKVYYDHKRPSLKLNEAGKPVVVFSGIGPNMETIDDEMFGGENSTKTIYYERVRFLGKRFGLFTDVFYSIPSVVTDELKICKFPV